MLHLLLISLAVTLFLDDAAGGATRVASMPAWQAAAIMTATMGALASGVLGFGLLCARRLRRTGRGVWVVRAQRAGTAVRVLAVCAHAALVLGFGWLDAVRAITGDWILLDEALAVAPALLVFFASWLAFGPIDRLLWEGALIRTLDEGAPLHPPRGAWRYALDQARHGAAIVLVPLAIIWTWSECVGVVADRAGVSVDSDAAALALSAAQFVGVLLAFVVTPPLMMRVWRTVSLGPGELRSRLEEMCGRHKVRCRDIRVWQTDGAMLNGAVMGLFAPVRYILLTDALLESLPEAQVEAVAAHEIAHIKRRHLPWLLGAMLAAIWLGGTIVVGPFDLLARAAGWKVAGTPLDWASQTVGGLASIAFAVVAFGAVSRAFERQADAFAAQSLSGLEAKGDGERRITPEATEAMAGALGAVARLNAIPAQRFFWRHGSIEGRRRRIRALEGSPVRSTPADRAARRLKVAAALGLLAMACVEGASLVATMR